MKVILIIITALFVLDCSSFSTKESKPGKYKKAKKKRHKKRHGAWQAMYRFEDSIGAKKWNQALAAFEESYRKEQHDKHLQGRTEQFLAEFLSGRDRKGRFVVPKLNEIVKLRITDMRQDPHTYVYKVRFTVYLKTGTISGEATMIKKKGGYFLVGAMG